MDRLPRLQTNQPAPSQPKLHLNGITPSTPFAGSQTPAQDPADITSPIDARRAKLFSTLSRRPTTSNIHDFRYAWSFYHDAASAPTSTSTTNLPTTTDPPATTTTTTTTTPTPSAAYASRLTLLQDDITNPKLFWQVMNNFPFHALKLKDSVHFFKRGVKPVWEDRRNVRGGAWTFRIPKAQAEDFFREVVLMGIGEQFADALQSGDDLCGLSLSIRYNSNLISIWHRRADLEKSKAQLLQAVEATLSPELRDLCVSKNYYYKAHNEHAGFSDVVARVREGEGVDGGGEEKTEKVEEKAEKREQGTGAAGGGMEISDI